MRRAFSVIDKHSYQIGHEDDAGKRVHQELLGSLGWLTPVERERHKRSAVLKAVQ